MRADQQSNTKVAVPSAGWIATCVGDSELGRCIGPGGDIGDRQRGNAHAKRFGVLFGAMLLLGAMTGQAFAQQSATPQLESRSNEAAAAEGRTSVDATQRRPSTLPADASGAYRSSQLDKSIEIEVVNGKLGGYVSQLGDAETDSNTPLTFFFDQTSVDGNHLEFQTRVVHGIWFSFYGSVTRGDGETRADEGYYVLHGVFREHHPSSGQDKSADETVEKSVATFKSVRQ